MPNSASALRNDELGWSDEPDDYEYETQSEG